MFIIYNIIAGVLSGAIGAMGLGGGGVLLIYLTVFSNVEQLKAQGINLLFFMPIGILAIVISSFKKQIKWKSLFKIWIGGAIGAGLGFLCAKTIPPKWLSIVFGVFLIVFGLFQLFNKPQKKT